VRNNNRENCGSPRWPHKAYHEDFVKADEIRK
jgi:hypothetical protein